MTVRQLIEKLSQIDPDSEVKIVEGNSPDGKGNVLSPVIDVAYDEFTVLYPGVPEQPN